MKILQQFQLNLKLEHFHIANLKKMHCVIHIIFLLYYAIYVVPTFPGT